MAQRQPLAAAARQDSLDQETLDRWVTYLHAPAKQHPYLKDWEGLLSRHAAEAEMRKASDAFQELAVETLRQKRAVDEYNRAISYGAKTQRMLGDVVGRTMDRAHYMLWQELAAEGNPHANDAVPDARVDGVLYYKGEKVERFLPPSYREHLAQMRTRLGQLKAAMPPQYPYLSIIQDVPKPENLHVFIRGNAQNPGEEAPRAFLTALRDCAPQPFTRGSGRLELAEAIANPHNPLTARVMVNRVWQYHFGYGIVRTPSNFGLTGDRPSNAPLLDYLASRLVENRWSLKALHREILLSSTYALSADRAPENTTADPDNRLNWRYNRQRLDAEALRDALLFVAGDLDPKAGGPPVPLEDSKNHRRTVYGRISRQRINPMLAMFDFPNPNITSEQRVPTTVPLQRLFLLNSGLMMQQADALAARIAREAGDGPEARIRHAYHLLFQRSPKPREIAAALDFLQTGAAAWPEYAQVLLSSNEFLYVD
jgi:hypothetical protein